MTVSASPVALTGADQVVAVGPATYRGFALYADGGPAVVRVWDNASAASGTLLDVVAVPDGGSAQAWYSGGGIRAGAGVYVEVVSGDVEGSVRIG